MSSHSSFNFIYYHFTATTAVFGTAEVNGTILIQRAVLKVQPYDPDIEELLMTGNNYDKGLLPFFNSTAGTLEIRYVGSEVLSNFDWSFVMRFMAYRLLPAVRTTSRGFVSTAILI